MNSLAMINLMRKFFISAIIAVISSLAAFAQQPEHAFQYPVPPDNLETLGERTSYLVEHFWDRCNLKSIFSSKKNFEQSFIDYISFMPYADSTVVFNSIEKLIKEVKKNPANLQTMAQIARAQLYSDTAEIRADIIYLPFARAAVSTGGISKEEKDRYTLEISQLSNSQPGMKLPSFNFVQPDGTTKSIDDINGSYILIMFDEPGDFDNMMARTRLATDYGLNDLIKQGYVKVLYLYPGKPDQKWKDNAEGYPDNWIIGASPEAYALFDQRSKPTYYYTNRDHVILSKTFTAESLVDAFRAVRNQQNKIKEERERLRREASERKNTGAQ